MENARSMEDLFSLRGRVAVVTGGTGVLGRAIVHGLARAGARIAILGRSLSRIEEMVGEIEVADGEALALIANVLDKQELQLARDRVVDHWGGVDCLINVAGGNIPEATVGPGGTFFDLAETALREVIDLNLLGTVLPTQVFGQAMTRRDVTTGSIVNVSSASAARAMTRVVGYGAAKAAIENFTKWAAVELGQSSGGRIRVNAIAPGFFIGEQNRALLLEPDGRLTPRGQKVIDHTPAGRFGEPEELVGTVIWLCGPGAKFVNGVVIPIDGGFSAFSGV